LELSCWAWRSGYPPAQCKGGSEVWRSLGTAKPRHCVRTTADVHIRIEHFVTLHRILSPCHVNIGCRPGRWNIATQPFGTGPLNDFQHRHHGPEPCVRERAACILVCIHVLPAACYTLQDPILLLARHCCCECQGPRPAPLERHDAHSQHTKCTHVAQQVAHLQNICRMYHQEGELTAGVKRTPGQHQRPSAGPGCPTAGRGTSEGNHPGSAVADLQERFRSC
jgi:hypothetical protein